MKSYQETILAKIHRLKQSSFGAVTIDSRFDMKIPMTLRLISMDCLRDSSLIRTLARWRKKHEAWFPAQFPVTSKRTAVWLQKRVLEEPDRLLFLIDVHGTYRGHVGLYRYNFGEKSCDIDNIVRGRAGYKGMMEQAIVLLMRWGQQEFGIETYTLETTSDNVRALALYTKIGFVETNRIPLVYRKTTDGGVWEKVDAHSSKNIQRYDVYMTRKGNI